MRSRRFEWTITAVFAAACFAWLAWALGRGDLTAFDEATRADIHFYAEPTLTLLMRAVTLMGSQVVILAGAAIAAGLLFLKRNRDGAWLILIGIGVAEMLEAVLKVQFHRQRPEPFFDAILPGTYSFPSGHAVLSLTLYGLLAWVIGPLVPVAARWAIRIAAILLILATGFSRVYLGVHHPTDVIGGYLAAVAWVAALLAVRGRTTSTGT